MHRADGSQAMHACCIVMNMTTLETPGHISLLGGSKEGQTPRMLKNMEGAVQSYIVHSLFKSAYAKEKTSPRRAGICRSTVCCRGHGGGRPGAAWHDPPVPDARPLCAAARQTAVRLCMHAQLHSCNLPAVCGGTAAALEGGFVPPSGSGWIRSLGSCAAEVVSCSTAQTAHRRGVLKAVLTSLLRVLNAHHVG